MNSVRRGTGVALGSLGLVTAGTLLYWCLRPNAASVDRNIVLETWKVVADGRHNSNTDFVFWNDWFWLVRQTSSGRATPPVLAS